MVRSLKLPQKAAYDRPVRSGDLGDYNDYRYEYDSGVGVMVQLHFESNTEIYIVNRGGKLAVARAFLYQAKASGTTTMKFDSGVAVLPPGVFCLLQHGPRQTHEEDLGSIGRGSSQPRATLS